jgi:hypothetical protein
MMSAIFLKAEILKGCPVKHKMQTSRAKAGEAARWNTEAIPQAEQDFTGQGH